MKIGVGKPSDVKYVMSLMRKNRESVGGLPQPAVIERLHLGTVLIAREDVDPVGYVMYDRSGGVVRIPQACIQYDARRRKFGEALLAALLRIEGVGLDEVRVRCAADLEANVFWRDMGFSCVGSCPGGARRGRTINAWQMWLTPQLFSIHSIAVLPTSEVRIDSRYDDSGFLDSAPRGFKPAVQLPKMAWANRK